MKDLEQPLKIVPDTQLVAEFQKEYTLKAKMVVQRGLILYGMDLEQMKATKVNITKNVMVGVDGKPIKENRAQFEPNVIYVWATNEYNAMRKVQRDLEKFIRNNKEKEIRDNKVLDGHQM